MSTTSNITKALLQKICQHAQKGEFTEALRLVSKEELKEDYALTVIAACSYACHKACSENTPCDVDNLETLLLLLVSCLDLSEEGPLTKYMQAVYHIIKLVVKKEKIGNLMRLKSIINPRFINKITLKFQKLDDIYVALIQIISKSMKQAADCRNENSNIYFLQITELILNAQSKRDRPLDLLNLAQYCASVLKKLESEDNKFLICYQYQEFYVMLLRVIGEQYGTNQDALTIIELLAPILSSMITPMIKSTNLDFLTKFLLDVESQSKRIFEQAEYAHMHQMYKVILALLPSDTENYIADARKNLQNVKSHNKKLFNTVLSELVRPIIQISVFYKVTKIEMWTGMKENRILSILKFIRDDFIHANLMLVPSECNCGCGIIKNYEECLRMGWNWNLLFKSYMDKSTNLTEDFHAQLLKWLHLFYEVIKKLKDHNCKLWKEYYSELASRTYNIGVILYKTNQLAHKNVFICYLKYSLEIEGCSPVLGSVNMSVFAFGCLCDAEQKKNSWATCMGLAALQSLVYPEHSESNFLYYWMRSKVKASEDPNNHQDLHTETVVTMLLKQEKHLNNIYNFKHLLTEKRQIALLSFELAQYKAKWQSKKAVLSAFLHVTKLADVPTLTDVVLDIFGDGQVILEEDDTARLQNVIKKMTNFLKKNPSQHKVSLAIAALYYHIFKSLARVAASKNLEDMEKTMQVLESAKKDECIEIVPKDANDECDIVSAYANLRLQNYSETIKSLNKSIDYIISVKNKTFDIEVLKNVPKLLHKIGFEYRLHCYTIKTLQTFETAMQFSKIIRDEEGVLFAISFLIESADVKRKEVLDLVNTGDNVAESLEKANVDERYSKTIALFHISKCKAFLAAEDYCKAKNSCTIADKFCVTNKEKDDFTILQAELHVLRYKLTRRCDPAQGDHQEEPMTTRLHMAYDVACETVRRRVVTSYELCMIFDAAYELTKTYLLINLPRDLRAYSKNFLLLAQKIILPLRCLKFLVFLAHSDLLSSKFDHCSEKLNGIDDIFSLNRTSAIQKVTSKPTAKIIKNDIEVCSNLIQELVLDVPQHTRQYSPSSPSLRVDGFELPEFIKHEISCTCFFCLSLDLQVLLLEKARLNALLNMYEENELAEDFCKGALLLYDKLGQKYEHFQKKTSELTSSFLLPSFEDVFLEPYSYLLHDYSYFLARNGRLNEAFDHNLKLIKLLISRKQTYVCLYVDALLQRLCYIKQEETKQVEGSLKLERSPNQVLFTTPIKTTKNKSPVSIFVNGIKEHPATKTKRTVTKCNLFGTDDKSPKFAVPQSKILKNVEILKPSTPLFSVFSTPRIEIFTDNAESGAVKSYSRKRTVNKNEDKRCNLFDKGDSESGGIFEDGPIKTYTRSRGIKAKSTSETEVMHKSKSRTASTTSREKGKFVDELLSNSERKAKPAKPDEKKTKNIDELLQTVYKDESSDLFDADVLPGTPENKIKNGSLRSTLKKKTEPERKQEKKINSARRVAANLFDESTGTKCTGAVRKSTRNRL